MNLVYGVIAAVGVLVAISLGLIASSPDDVIEPRMMTVDEKIKPCTKEYRPVCGVDGKTYGNMCMLEATAVKLDYQGECKVSEEPIACTLEWNPMCGVDGETYGNPCMLDAAGVELDYEGECVVAEPEQEPMIPVSTTHTVEIPQGVSVPGCEETDECYLPHSVQVNVGDTVVWNNVDTAAHTVTSGNISDGTDGVFDSSLFMSGDSFEFTFIQAGSYDYFCMVHPWMTGVVVVNEVEEMVMVSEPEITKETMEKEPEPSTMSLTVSIPEGTGVPGCEETNECFVPYEFTVKAGTTVTWSNDDTATHTVTSGNINAGQTSAFDSGMLMAGDTFEFTFQGAGNYDYFCMIHPWMTGIVHIN